MLLRTETFLNLKTKLAEIFYFESLLEKKSIKFL